MLVKDEETILSKIWELNITMKEIKKIYDLCN